MIPLVVILASLLSVYLGVTNVTFAEIVAGVVKGSVIVR